MTMPYEAESAQLSKPRKRKWTATTWVLGSLAAVFSALCIAVGFTPRGSDCGSVFVPNTFLAELKDSMSGSLGTYASSCDDALARGRTYVITYLILTFIAVGIAGIVAATRHQRRITAGLYQQMQAGQPVTIHGQASIHPVTSTSIQPAGSTSAQRLEELTRLHQLGLVNDSEFEAKRTEILSQL